MERFRIIQDIAAKGLPKDDRPKEYIKGLLKE